MSFEGIQVLTLATTSYRDEMEEVGVGTSSRLCRFPFGDERDKVGCS